MRIAVPIQQGRFSAHFGGADAFAFYTVDETTRTVGARHLDAPPEHGRGVFPSWLRHHHVNVVLAGGMGPRALNLLGQHGIEVVIGVEGDNPDTMVRAWLDGTLEATGEACHEHGYHDCGHHHGGGGNEKGA
jgi:predicted Fe-Mo cluster-binding NifX family protein